uniref:VPS37 C-terminal domain-containing protein n=1 Tax=Steinernema glaseri TaxID=37863 RepID=A0A1I7ZQF2_9BILA
MIEVTIYTEEFYEEFENPSIDVITHYVTIDKLIIFCTAKNAPIFPPAFPGHPHMTLWPSFSTPPPALI